MEMETKTERALAEQAAQLTPGTLRHEALTAARKFKNSWVELGATLVKVRDSGDWASWGFASFEAYCVRELRLKRQTALKLTASYGFLSRHERNLGEASFFSAERPDDAPRSPSQRAPAFEVVSVLAGAEERGQFSEGDYRDLRERIWGDEAAPAKLTRELTERFPPPPKPDKPIDFVLKKLAMTARKLAQEMGTCPRVPGELADRAAVIAEEIDALWREAGEEADDDGARAEG